MAHHAEIVGDEQHREAEPVLQLEQQVDDLRLHRDVERRDRFVRDHERRIERERAGDADALPLASGEGVRETRARRRRQADQVEQLAHPRLTLRAGHAGDQQGSAMMSPTIMRGFSDA